MKSRRKILTANQAKYAKRDLGDADLNHKDRKEHKARIWSLCSLRSLRLNRKLPEWPAAGRGGDGAASAILEQLSPEVFAITNATSVIWAPDRLPKSKQNQSNVNQLS